MSQMGRKETLALKLLRVSTADQATEGYVERLTKTDPEISKSMSSIAECWDAFHLLRKYRIPDDESKTTSTETSVTEVSPPPVKNSVDPDPDLVVSFHYEMLDFKFDHSGQEHAVNRGEIGDFVDQIESIAEDLRECISIEYFSLPHKLSTSWQLIDYELEIPTAFLVRIQKELNRKNSTWFEEIPFRLHMKLAISNNKTRDKNIQERDKFLVDFIESNLFEIAHDFTLRFSQTISYTSGFELVSCLVHEPFRRNLPLQ